MLFELETTGDPDDGMISVYTGCVDGNGKRTTAVVKMACARNANSVWPYKKIRSLKEVCTDLLTEIEKDLLFYAKSKHPK